MSKVLTISVAAYNVEDTIEDTLSSLVADPGTMERLEVLIVDDGSSDGTSDIAGRFVSEYPDTFRLIKKTNGGYGSTINTSVSQAQGRYFKQLDGGDVYITENLSRFVAFLSDTDSDIVISPYEEFYMSDGKSILKDAYAGLRARTASVEREGDRASGGLKAAPESSEIGALDDGHLIKMHEVAFKTQVWREFGRNIPEHCFYTDTEYVFYPMVYAEGVGFFDSPVYRYHLQCEGQSVSIEGIRKHYGDSEKMMWDMLDAYDSVISGPLKDAPQGKMNILRGIIKHAVSFAYTSHIQAGSGDLGRLRTIDARMKKEYPDIYEFTSSVRRIGLMRKTGFRLYGLYTKMLGSDRSCKRFGLMKSEIR